MSGLKRALLSDALILPPLRIILVNFEYILENLFIFFPVKIGIKMSYVCPTPVWAHIHVDTTDNTSTDTGNKEKAKPEDDVDSVWEIANKAYIRYNRP